MVYGLFKSTCVTWTLELALSWIIHNAGIELPLARKIVLGYSPSHETGCLQTELIQPMVKIARIHRPLPVDCLFPSHKGFSSLASSPVANSTQLNNIFSEHAGALADTTKPSMPLRTWSELSERLTLTEVHLGSNSAASYQNTGSWRTKKWNQPPDFILPVTTDLP